MTKSQIMNLIPKSKKTSVYDAWEDSDGVWIMLNEGWNADGMDSECRTIHEDGEDYTTEETIKELRYQIELIRKIN